MLRFKKAILKHRLSRLFFFYVVGCTIGALLFVVSDPDCIAVCSELCRQSTSLLSLLIGLFLPVVLAAVLSGVDLALRFLLMTKAALYCYTGCVLFSAYPNSAWLIRILALFSETVGMIVFLVYLFLNKVDRSRIHIVILLLLVTLGAFDYFLISPFITEILSR